MADDPKLEAITPEKLFEMLADQQLEFEARFANHSRRLAHLEGRRSGSDGFDLFEIDLGNVFTMAAIAVAAIVALKFFFALAKAREGK